MKKILLFFISFVLNFSFIPIEIKAEVVGDNYYGGGGGGYSYDWIWLADHGNGKYGELQYNLGYGNETLDGLSFASETIQGLNKNFYY